MNRNTRVAKAAETLNIIKNGSYTVNNGRIELKDTIEHSINCSKLYKDKDFDRVMNDVSGKISILNNDVNISVEHATALHSASVLTKNHANVGCLNFASAKNPGGGFLGGALAQEESLALSSALYPTLMQHFEMYSYNRSRDTYLYSDWMIYSPNVAVFRNDDGELLDTGYNLSFVTSPAVNIGAMRANRPTELEYVTETMLARMDKVLALFVSHNIEHIILGAWGCGVFQNNPEDIAEYFKSYLTKGGKYEKCFKTVVFAIFDRSKGLSVLSAFKNIFEAKRKL